MGSALDWIATFVNTISTTTITTIATATTSTTTPTPTTTSTTVSTTAIATTTPTIATTTAASTTTTITTFLTTAPPLHAPVCHGDASTNIVGGTDAPRCGHPWMVSLQTSSNFHFCGGSLIDATHVLSAAHCCANMGNGAGYKAVIGDWKIKTDSSMDRCPGEQTRTFSAVDMHPSYNPTSTSNDFCVITLATPVVAGTLVPQLASARPTDGE